MSYRPRGRIHVRADPSYYRLLLCETMLMNVLLSIAARVIIDEGVLFVKTVQYYAEMVNMYHADTRGHV